MRPLLLMKEYQCVQIPRYISLHCWDMIVLVIVRKKSSYEHVYLILNGYQDRAVLISRPNWIRFLFVRVGWRAKFAKEKWILQTNCWLAFWSAAAHIKKREDKLRQTTRDLRTWVTKCIEVDGGLVEHWLWTVTNMSFKHLSKIKIKLTVSNFSLYVTIYSAFVLVD